MKRRHLLTTAIGHGRIAAETITDFLDGYLARRWQIESTLGAFLDTTADKLLVTGFSAGGVATAAGYYEARRTILPAGKHIRGNKMSNQQPPMTKLRAAIQKAKAAEQVGKKDEARALYRKLAMLPAAPLPFFRDVVAGLVRCGDEEAAARLDTRHAC